jgi:hypothetical protein
MQETAVPLASVGAAPVMAAAAAAVSPGRWLDEGGDEFPAAPVRVRSPRSPRSRHLSPNPSPAYMSGHGCGRARGGPCSAGACCGASPVEPGAASVSPLSPCQRSGHGTPVSASGARGSFCLAGDGAALARAEAFLSGLRSSPEDGCDLGCSPCSSGFNLGRQYGPLSPHQDPGRSIRDPSPVAPACDLPVAGSSMHQRPDVLHAEAEACAPTHSRGEAGASSAGRAAQDDQLTPSAPCAGPSRDGAADLTAILELLASFWRQVGSPVLSLPDPKVVRRRLFSKAR